MNNIKPAFDSVRASGELKGKTLVFISEKSRNYTMKKAANYLKIIPASAILAAFLGVFFGVKLYFTPTTHINIDTQPPLDLGVNLFDRVISVNGLDNDKSGILNDLDLKFSAYDEALRKIFGSADAQNPLFGGESLSVTVIETNSPQSENILAAARECTGGYSNVHCHSVSPEDASAAAELGLSYEKYAAYLELSAVYPGITPEAVRNMTMREIRELAEQLTGNGEQFNGQNGEQFGGQNGEQSGGHDNEHNEHENYSVPDNSSSSTVETGHHGEEHGHGHNHG